MNKRLIPKRLVEISLFNIAAMNPAALIEDGEQAYRRRLELAADSILASGAKIIMLTGPSSSGKTTTSIELAETLEQHGTPAQVVSLDNFFIGAENYPILPNGNRDYESPATLDMPEINRCLAELNQTGKADIPIYDFARERRADHRQHIDLQGGVCIMEGIHALNPLLTELLPDDGVFYIYAGLREEYAQDGVRTINTREIRLCRRVLRDMMTRGHSPEKTLSMWNDVLEGENQYVRIYKPRADLILDTSFTYELGVMAGLLDKALHTLDASCPQYAMMQETARDFAGVRKIPVECVPADSMLREFYGAFHNA